MPENPAPRPRTEAKIILGVVVLAAAILALFLIWGPELDFVTGATTGDDGALQAPAEVYGDPGAESAPQ